MGGIMLMSFLNPTSITRPHPQGESPIRCITTVLLIGWDLSVNMKDCNDGMCIFLWSVVCFYCHQMWYVVLTCICSSDDVQVLIILHQVKYANKNKTNIPVRKSVNGKSKQLQQLIFVLLFSIICFCLDILQLLLSPSFSISLCSGPLLCFTHRLFFAIRRRPVVHLRRPDLKTGGWWMLRTKRYQCLQFFFFSTIFAISSFSIKSSIKTKTWSVMSKLCRILDYILIICV